MVHQRRPGGFTLIELLVVIAIIAVLIGLLLPAVQRVRESAINTQCKNNLHQIGLALHAYHSANDTLPPGINYRDARKVYWSWMAYILPYMEQENLWNAAVASGLGVWSGNPAEGKHMKCYICPMDPRSEIQLVMNTNPWGVVGPIAFTMYYGNSGTKSRANDGVLYIDSRVRLTDITDGTSSTLMAGERPPSVDLDFGWWFGGWGYDGSAIGDNLMAARDPGYPASLATWNTLGLDGRPCPTSNIGLLPGVVYNPCDQTHYWSHHPGGVNFLMCDDSVRFVPYSANPILPALSTRNGNEVFTLP
jgi:prepilin-type N-terminal cleavage/methylation domain-containing protein